MLAAYMHIVTSVSKMLLSVFRTERAFSRHIPTVFIPWSAGVICTVWHKISLWGLYFLNEDIFDQLLVHVAYVTSNFHIPLRLITPNCGKVSVVQSKVVPIIINSSPSFFEWQAQFTVNHSKMMLHVCLHSLGRVLTYICGVSLLWVLFIH